MDQKRREIAEYWGRNDVFDSQTRELVTEMLRDGNEGPLEEAFGTDLEFGTAGLRGIMGPGTSRMNVYNIQRATAALAVYLKQCHGEKEIRVGVTFDSRHGSKAFAHRAAQVLAGYGIRALVTRILSPVPLLSFMVREYRCHAGICITASHNPPDYNGFKVYWSTGGQITPPHDSNIIGKYREMEDLSVIPVMSLEQAEASELIQWVGPELEDLYLERLRTVVLYEGDKSQTKIVFTPLHGTSGKVLPRALKSLGFDGVTVVPSQKEPNGDFPTVEFPNPEDPKAYAEALNVAKEIKADLVLATDPDCDRVGMNVLHHGEYVFLNGNEMGALLVNYVLSQQKAKGLLSENAVVIKTIVTTQLENAIAKHHGVALEETLTGFKWIAERIEDYESGNRKPYRKYVCGGEEAHGFLVDTFVRDKDGISACCVAAEMAAFYQSKGMTLLDGLKELYRTHGVFADQVVSVTLKGAQGARQIAGVMSGLRVELPLNLGGSPLHEVRDILEGKIYQREGEQWVSGKGVDLPVSNVLQFLFSDGSCVSVRPSGTEPKIKFYFSIRADQKNSDLALEKEAAQGKLERIRDDLLKRVGLASA